MRPTAFGVLAAAAARALDGGLDIVTPLPLDTDMNYDFGGSTVVSRNSIRLTGDFRGENGWLLSRETVPEAFELELDFKIDGESKNLYGDGMALWFLESPLKEGDMMGLNGYFQGVAVVVDTYRNGKGGLLFPRMQVLQNDGTMPYDRDNDGRNDELGSCGLRGIHNNNRQDVTKLRVTHRRSTGQFLVEVNYRNKWEKCVDTSVTIGPEARIALSAATGDLHEEHTITRLQVSEVSHSGSAVHRSHHNEYSGSSRDSQRASERSPSMIRSFFRFVFRMLLLAAVGYAALLGFKTFKKYQQSREDERYKLS